MATLSPCCSSCSSLPSRCVVSSCAQGSLAANELADLGLQGAMDSRLSLSFPHRMPCRARFWWDATCGWGDRGAITCLALTGGLCWGLVMNPVGFHPIWSPILLDLPSPWASHPLRAPISFGLPSLLGIPSPWFFCSLGVPIPLGILSLPPWVSHLRGSPVPFRLSSPWVSHPLWVSCPLCVPTPWELPFPHLTLCCFPPDLPPVLLWGQLAPHLWRVPHPTELGDDSSPLRRQVSSRGSPTVSRKCHFSIKKKEKKKKKLAVPTQRVAVLSVKDWGSLLIFPVRRMIPASTFLYG